MKPVAIFRHAANVGPGYFTRFLDRRQIAWQLIAIDEGDPIPSGIDDYSGLCFLGGGMSVNDDLTWISPELELIRRAVRQNIPVIGHCLGGQLMAKALGGTVGANTVKEIGWGHVTPVNTPVTAQWIGDTAGFKVFQWHGETFSLPQGAVHILSNQHCANQAFVLNDLHLGMQCHVEMTEQMIVSWNQQWVDEIVSPCASVQTPEEQLAVLAENLGAMRRISDRLYTRWISGLGHI